MKKAVTSIITGMLMTDFLFQYLLLDRDIFYETKQCFTEEMEQEVYQYSDEVKGAFVTVESESDLFPPDLVRKLEEMLYQPLDRDFHKLTWEETSKSRYFEFTKKYGSEEFALHSEEIEEYRKRTGAENCENLKHPRYNIAVELKQMALADEPGPELVQLWFKELEGKVYTFCLYHVSEYNYVLNTVLFEENRMSRVRTDIICPQRYFTLTEGERFKSF